MLYVIVILLMFLNQQWIEEESLMCHQCQRNDKGRVVRCTKCKRKRYCIPCLNNWYNFIYLCFTLFNLLHRLLVVLLLNKTYSVKEARNLIFQGYFNEVITIL